MHCVCVNPLPCSTKNIRSGLEFLGVTGTLPPSLGSLPSALVLYVHVTTLWIAFAICHSPFAMCHLPFTICHLQFAICQLSFAICHLPFAICHFPFAICVCIVIPTFALGLPIHSMCPHRALEMSHGITGTIPSSFMKLTTVQDWFVRICMLFVT